MKIFRYLFLVICSGSITVQVAVAQTSGTNSFALLNLPFNARSAALGNDFISVKDQDINLGITNPSLLNDKMDNTVGFNQAFIKGGINYGMVGYGKKLKKGVFSGSVRYVNYGEFTRRDEAGNEEGTFRPFEGIIGAGYGIQLNPRISIGANVNFLYSQMENYNAFGASIDVAGTYTSKNEDLLVTAMVKNAGMQFDGYYSKSKYALPAEFQMAISYKLEHAPFRFSLLLHHLNKWDISYVDPNAQPTVDALTGDTIPVDKAGFGELIFRHITIQTEILVSSKIHLRLAYDFQRRQETRIEQRTGLSGASFGIGMYFKRFSLDYGCMIMSKAGAYNLLTITTNLSKWRKS